MDCRTCKDGRPADVPFIVHEADMARMERTNKRSTAVIVLLIIALLASWLGFVIHESKYETVTEMTQDVWQEADNGGIATNRFIGGDYYGNPAESAYNGEDVPQT